MIESCSKKRMVLGLSFLGGLTFLVLIIESHWAGNNHNHISGNIAKNSSFCWLHEDFSIVEECHLCTNFEIASGSVEACQATHYKETVLCQHSGKVLRSCDRVRWLEERNFWLFEGCMLVLGLISAGTAKFRQAVLDHRMLRRIQRQIAAGV